MRPPTKCVPGALVTANGEQIGTSFSIIGYGAMPIGEKMDLEDKQHFKTIAAVPVVQQEDWQSRQKRERSDLAPDPAYCLRRTEIMLSCYRKDETHNPEVYSSAVSAVLADGYSREIVDYVTDPRTGLPSRNKFLPSVAEVREACDERAAHIDRIKRYETLTPVPPPPMMESIRARSRRTSGTSQFSIRCATPNWRQRVSRAYSATRMSVCWRPGLLGAKSCVNI